MIILIILIIVLLLSLSLINKTLKKKNVKLDNDNKLNENVIKRKQFSMYVENGNGEYIEYSSSNMFPVGYAINLDKSICIDNAGKEVKGILSGNGNKITVTSNKTVFCYVYFDKTICNEKENLSKCLINNSNNGTEEIWKSTLEDDGYRYVGTSPDNYICFGTTNKEECTNNTDKYMYRIIGIFEDETGNSHLKLIKKEALNTTYQWYSSDNDIEWNESNLYKGLNGSYFLTNNNYSYMRDANWLNKISTWNYTMTNEKAEENHINGSSYGIDYQYSSVKSTYLHELNRSSKSNQICYYNSLTNTIADCNVGNWKSLSAKISLMYVSDYALSLGEEALNYVPENNYSIMKTGWMHISNNDTNTREYTMTRYGKTSGNSNNYRAISNTGGIYWLSPTTLASVRPVFYLNTNEMYSGGIGTLNNPIMISMEEDNSAVTTLINSVSSDVLWQSTLEDDGYRYVGATPDNYICFGTTSKEECINNTEKYMYRIIGIFEDEIGKNHLKLIKKEALNATYAWNSNNQTNIDWNKSDLYKGLNGNYFLTNTEYSYMQDTSWTNKIATWNYTMTNTKTYENYNASSVYGPYYYDNTGSVIYLHELNRKSKSNKSCYFNYNSSPADANCNVGEWNTLNTKISLMYVSDYALSLGEVALNYVGTNNSAAIRTGWLLLENSDSNTISKNEWTMTRLGNSNYNYYGAWSINSSGHIGLGDVSSLSSIRPVFYLESDVELSTNTGDGSITNPYMILN